MSPPVRVAHIVGNLETGGMQILVMELMRHLDRRRFDPILIYFKSPNHFEDEIRAKGWTCRKVRVSRRYRIRDLRRLARVLRDERIDIIHPHADVACFAGRAAAVAAGTPHILAHYHNRYYHRLDDRFRRLEALLYPYTDRVLACSEGVREFLTGSLVLPPDRIRVILNGRDLGPFIATGKNRQEARRNLGIPDNVFHVVHTARLESHKAPERLLNALCLLEEKDGPWRATFVGGGSLLEDLQALSGRLRTNRGTGPPLAERVAFVGWSENIPQFLAAGDVFVLCSKNEGLGLTVIEAIATGTPVICSDIEGPREVIRNGETGLLVDAADPEALAAALRSIRTDSDLRARLVKAGFESLPSFSLDRFVGETQDIYDDVRSQPGATAPRPRGFLQIWRFLRSIPEAAR